VRPVLAFLFLLAACNDGSGVPVDNVRDYRATFSSAEASGSCTDGIASDADSFVEISKIYRVHWPEGPESAAIDLYWRNEGDSEETFSYFASGMLDGTLDEGHFVYAGGPFSELRGDGATVSYEIDGRVRTSFGDLLQTGTERYTLISSTDQGAWPVGCVFTLGWNGALLPEQDTE
jgi:hypothetical protein